MKQLLIITLFLLTAAPALAAEWKATHVETNATFTFTFPYQVENLEGFRLYQDGTLLTTIPPDVDRVVQPVSFVYGRDTSFTLTAFTADEEGVSTAPFLLRPPIPPPQSFGVIVDFGAR